MRNGGNLPGGNACGGFDCCGPAGGWDGCSCLRLQEANPARQMNKNKKANKRLSLLYLDTNCIENCWFIPNPPASRRECAECPALSNLFFKPCLTRAARVQNDKTHFEPQMDADSHRIFPFVPFVASCETLCLLSAFIRVHLLATNVRVRGSAFLSCISWFIIHTQNTPVCRPTTGNPTLNYRPPA